MTSKTRPSGRHGHHGRRAPHRVVIVGGGMAGARLARHLGELPRTEVTVVAEEPHAPYNRVLLAEVLAGRYGAEVIGLPEPARTVRRLSGVRAVRLDRAERRVVCDNGALLPYDSLVLATGSNPVLPPLRGLFPAAPGTTGRARPNGALPDHTLPDGVLPFRTMDDCLALTAAVRTGSPAAVIGGGLLGVSAARALALRGARVVLAHQGEHLMERHLDPAASALLHRHLAALGVEVHTECRVRGLLTGPSGGTAHRAPRAGGVPGHPAPGTPAAGRTARAARAVRAVELADGYRPAAEAVVLTCGVRPRTGLARAAGLAVARGIAVDDGLRTSDPRIFAIGDCAEHAGVLYGLAGPAQEQADVLARILAARSHGGTGEGLHYRGTRALTRLTLAAAADPSTARTAATVSPVPGALDLAAFGETEPRPDDDVVRLSDATRSVYRKVVVRGDRLVGGILLGDLGPVGELARAWEGDEPLPSAPLLHLLTTDGGS